MIKKLIIIAFSGICLLIMTGLVYEKLSEYIDHKKYAPPGQIIEVNGHDMHIFAKGENNATVVFASGWGIPCPYVEYYPLYSEVSKQARIVVYDRPGYGWSSTSKTPRNIDLAVEELHELLELSGEKPPYILVGHSIGSLEVIRFSQIYKDEVKGIVLLDGGNPTYYANEILSDSATSSLKLKSILNSLGIFRLLFTKSPEFLASVYAPRNNFSLIPDELKELDQAMYLSNMVNKNKSDEINNLQENASIVTSAGSLGDTPLVILTSESEAADPEWKKSQTELANWSTESEQRIVPGTNHNMQQYVPDIIVDEILKLINNISE